MKLNNSQKLWVQSIRRQIHQTPELSFKEFKTSKLIETELNKLDYEPKIIAKTGVTAVTGNTNGKIIGFRADMDALPLKESKTSINKDYISKVDGQMHACGHDSHVAIMLGVANLLQNNEDFKKNNAAKFIFQPAEEGGAGAATMIKEGALKTPVPDILLAGHVSPSLEAGHFGIVRGISHASADMFKIIVKGKGGHAARPELTIDPIVASANLIIQIQTIISRNINALKPAVITIGMVQGGTKCNIIPDSVELQGTIRSHDEESRLHIIKRIKELAKGLDKTFRTSTNFKMYDSYPMCYNNEELTEFIYEKAVKILGKKLVHWWAPSMGGEDFAFYTSHLPCSMLRIGTRNEKKGITNPIHNSKFDIDEVAMYSAVHLFSELSVEYVKN